ncbi:MAG: substrate-binding domain-containing protein [Alphaproteobacteria bacterium]|nr:substrate-binding domain-containing protein [Alphaproteobacteria bacterium]
MRIETKPVEAFGRRWFLRRIACCVMLVTGVFLPEASYSQAPLFLGVTTSVENSGLLAHLIDAFKAKHDGQIRAVTAGSGSVLNLAARGDVDVILVHAPEDEEDFINAGYGVDRRPVMRNRFVIVGPKADPAGVREADDAVAAFTAIAEHRALFLSRGDESGTHKAELRLWRAADVDLADVEPGDGAVGWYRESGSGQGATLNIAVNTGAYVLTDEATWATFGNPGDLETLFASDKPLLDNVYSVIRVNPERHPGLNAEGALILAGWLTSKAGQAAIENFKAGGKAAGRMLFRPIGRLAG